MSSVYDDGWPGVFECLAVEIKLNDPRTISVYRNPNFKPFNGTELKGKSSSEPATNHPSKD